MNPKVIHEEAVTMSEVKDILKDIKKRDEELTFRANKTEENLNALSTLDTKTSAELKKKLEDLKIPRFKDVHVNKIVDTLPETVDELKVILQGYTITVTNDNLKKIADVVKDYV